ncbi:GDSL-like lipase/acylhydrolase family protein [Frondihabitans sp. PhB188]|uniref:SGNH/GDSL hydrolase family protein n=1 Tax=Frondihabitans sp. PhB188 TaxID=2485200 RepID=UPI000F476884|nr:SGNH/GDSL hydrolase family protein [Frondihabitans sp. PhB188]ROQ38382.1 GDSL-like lipase/acylhydrolase family protein [Frondihabitans sp. PhB188]
MVARRWAAFVAALVMISVVAAPASASAATATGPYVALGDSYASGYGLPEATGEPVSGCGQSRLDYPHLLARELALPLTDVTCAGATTSDVVSRRQLGAQPQVAALSDSTRLVTITIGGNDADLIGTVARCIAVSANGPVFSTGEDSCKATLERDGVNTLNRSIDDTVVPKVRAAFRDIARAAPNARVFVVGYPALFPNAASVPAGGCFRSVADGSGFVGDGFPFTTTDVAFLGGMQSHLDGALRSATQRAGFTYVSTLAGSYAHSACATSDSYLEGITLSADSTFSSITLADGALHPNERGTRYLAAQTADAIRAAAATPPASPATADAGGFPLVWLVLAGIVVVFAAIALLVARSIRRSRRDRS